MGAISRYVWEAEVAEARYGSMDVEFGRRLGFGDAPGNLCRYIVTLEVPQIHTVPSLTFVLSFRQLCFQASLVPVAGDIATTPSILFSLCSTDVHRYIHDEA